jgi:iron(III) transport system permease protein
MASIARESQIQLKRDRERPVSTRPPVALMAAAVVIALLTLLPVVFVIQQTVTIDHSEIARLIWRPRVGFLLKNTARLMISVTLISAVLGVTVAWLVERTDLPGRRIWAVVAALPMTVPAFILSFSWISITPRVEGFGGAVAIVSLAYYPLVYLPVAAALRNMDPNLEDAARALGHGGFATFFRIVLPQARPAIVGGCLLVAIHALGEFGAFEMLRFATFTTAIYDQYRLTFNGPAASLLSAVLVACFLPILVAESFVRGPATDQRHGAANRMPVRYKLRASNIVAVLGLATLVGLALGVPIVTIAYWIRQDTNGSPIRDLFASAWDSLRLGAQAALLTTALAVPISLLAVRHKGRASMLIERSTYVATSLPSIAIALALITVTVRHAQPIYQTTAMLMVAYAILSLPVAIVAVRSTVAQVPATLEETARTLGARPISVFIRVTLPLMWPGLCAAAALVFLSVVTELTATLLLSPIGTHTLAMRVWQNTTSVDYPSAAPYAASILLMTALPTYVLMRRFGVFGAAS